MDMELPQLDAPKACLKLNKLMFYYLKPGAMQVKLLLIYT